MERRIETDAVLSTLIFADSKEGKSTLASTAPTPHLVLDAEGSWKFIDQRGYDTGVKLRKINWDPINQEMPRWDDTWDLVRVNVHSWQVLAQVYRWLTERDHDFVSLTLDSVTEGQRRCKANIRTGSQQMDQQAWGRLLDQMDGLIRGFRDLTMMPNTLRMVNFIAEMSMKDGRYRPFMQGQIRDTMPYFVDICGYLFTELQSVGDQQIKLKRLLIGAGVNPAYVVGERVQGRLSDIVNAPDLAEMLRLVYPDYADNSTSQPQPQPQPQPQGE